MEESKLTPEVLALEGMNSSRVRHLYNNLGSIGTKYLEIGVWRGASFISVCLGNDLKYLAIDNWTEFNAEGTVKDAFKRNCLEHLGKLNYVDQDCFQITEIPFKPDMYTYDGGHGEAEHIMAVTHFFPMMADRFLYLCDDFGEEGEGFYHVQTATRKALDLVSGEYKVEKEWVLPKKEGFWEGFFVALISRI
jgi:hypothetical protein